MSKMCNEAAYG
ncbi:hypothetical protein SOVF_013300, partial [Spinacia oleracea]